MSRIALVFAVAASICYRKLAMQWVVTIAIRQLVPQVMPELASIVALPLHARMPAEGLPPQPSVAVLPVVRRGSVPKKTPETLNPPEQAIEVHASPDGPPPLDYRDDDTLQEILGDMRCSHAQMDDWESRQLGCGLYRKTSKKKWRWTSYEDVIREGADVQEQLYKQVADIIAEWRRELPPTHAKLISLQECHASLRRKMAADEAGKAEKTKKPTEQEGPQNTGSASSGIDRGAPPEPVQAEIVEEKSRTEPNAEAKSERGDEVDPQPFSFMKLLRDKRAEGMSRLRGGQVKGEKADGEKPTEKKGIAVKKGGGRKQVDDKDL